MVERKFQCLPLYGYQRKAFEGHGCFDSGPDFSCNFDRICNFKRPWRWTQTVLWLQVSNLSAASDTFVTYGAIPRIWNLRFELLILFSILWKSRPLGLCAAGDRCKTLVFIISTFWRIKLEHFTCSIILHTDCLAGISSSAAERAVLVVS